MVPATLNGLHLLERVIQSARGRRLLGSQPRQRGWGVQAAGFAQGLTNLAPQLSALTSILPPPTLAWKLRLLAEGCRYLEGRCPPPLPSPHARTFAVSWPSSPVHQLISVCSLV